MAKKRKSQFRGVVSAHSKRQQEKGAQYGYLSLPKNASMFKETPGSILRFDILPYIVTDGHHPDRETIGDYTIAKKDSLWYRRPFKIHRNIGAEKDSVICLASFGQKCPICEERTRMMNSEGVTDDSKALKSSDRHLYVVVPIAVKKGSGDWEKLEAKPQLWTISNAMFQKKLDEELALDEDNEVFADLEEGLTLEVRFSSETIGGGQPFSEASRIDFKERKTPYEETILDDLPDLDAIIKNSALSYQVLKDKFFEIESEEDEEELEEEEEEKPTRRSKKQKEKEEEEEEEEEEETLQDSIPKKERCKACEGTGKNTRGKECRICKGTGRKPEEKEEKKTSENRCPCGHVFGADCESHEDCDSCDGSLWEECYDEKQKG